MSAATVANLPETLEHAIAQRRLSWTGPLLLTVGRSALILLAQAAVALIFSIRGHADPWSAAAPWWTVYGTLVDIGCLVMLRHFTRTEGVTVRGLVGPVRPSDLLRGLGFFLVSFPFFVAAGPFFSYLIFGTIQAPLPPGLLVGRVLPLWGVVYSLSLWWIIWSPTEELTYQGYALPRLRALSGSTWKAVALVSLWWALQHAFLPYLPGVRILLWRFLAFLPGCLVVIAIYLRTRRLAPLIVAHWLMDISGALITLQF